MSPDHQRSAAVVGASESMPWSYWLMNNLAGHGFTGPIWPVNPNRDLVHGRPAFAKLGDLPATPDVGVCVLGPRLAEAAIDELLELGTRSLVLISNGFRETGDAEGADRERRIAAACTAAGARLIGPNCVGFADFTAGEVFIAEPIPAGLKVGAVSVASQSGALLAAVLAAVHAGGSGIDVAYSLGNGAVFDVTDATVEFAHSTTARVLVILLEGITDPDRFAGAVAIARAAGKHVVVLRLGRSSRSAGMARSHTGSIVGPDRLTAAWLTRLGVVIADSIEELAVLVPLLERAELKSGGVFVLTASGGAASYAMDLAVSAGVRLAELAPATLEGLAACLPVGAYVGNPLDVVGANPQGKAAIRQLVYGDSDVALVLEPYALPWPDDDPARGWYRSSLEGSAAASKESGTPTVVASALGESPTSWVTALSAAEPLFSASSLVAAATALAKVYPASAASLNDNIPSAGGGVSRSVIAEAEARDVLEKLGFPVVAGSVADSPAAAGELAATIGGPVAVKAAVAGLAHKARAGGVRLDLVGRGAVEAACTQMASDLRANGVSEPARFLVQQMVRGPELLVGFIRDQTAGPSCTVGFGGWAAELAGPIGTLSLAAGVSVSVVAVTELLAGWGLRTGLGGSVSDQLAELLARLCDAFASGELTDYQTLELNPIVLTPNGPCIVDALLVVDGEA